MLTDEQKEIRKNKKKEYLKQWRQNNPDYQKNWHKKNPNYNQEYFENNKEEILNKQKKRYHKNIVESRIRARNYYYQNRDKMMSYAKNRYHTITKLQNKKVKNEN